ncbi:MAG: ABC transporter ATP-binding protein [Clostridia bacterium]|nr:ABC transporter ATP-binding protein [Clostridia bacterium]
MSLLSVKDLKTSFFTPSGEVKAVNGVSYEVEKGKVLGIVGESGSGKSVSAYSVLQILANPGKIVGGSIELEGEELVGIKEKGMAKIRGNKISIIFQDPMTSLNPVFTIGDQLMEAIMLHTNRNRKEAKERAIEMLKLVGVNEPKKRIKQYPHEFSGGMRQRVMIAMALACEPDILIADEPTTALDVTIQAQILDLMKDLQKKLGMAIILITHDLGVVAEMCDEVIVMYAGQICERGTAEEIFYNPKHEYTLGLMRSIPTVSDEKTKLQPIGGNAVDLLNLPPGCPFAPRCDAAMKVCLEVNPKLVCEGGTHYARCWNHVKKNIEEGKFTAEEIEALYNEEAK